MFDEFKKNESVEIKKVDSNSFKEIKPEKQMDKNKTVSFWKDMFENIRDSFDGKENDVKGGAYKDVKECADSNKEEVHHIPADSVTELNFKDGPTIKMDKEDHRQTASFGSSKEARAYREAQRQKIEQGKFKEAVQMDIDDIKEKFGNKYDKHIAELQKYVDKLESEGLI